MWQQDSGCAAAGLRLCSSRIPAAQRQDYGYVVAGFRLRSGRIAAVYAVDGDL
jgi:hypothetical protein